MERFHSLDWYQRIVLLSLIALLLVFTVVYCVVTSKEGFLYKDEIFIPIDDGSNTTYQGKLNKTQARFTVTLDHTVTFQYGDVIYGPYIAREDPSAVPEGKDYLTGIEISTGDGVYFRGCVFQNGDGNFVLFNEDGSFALTIIASNADTMTTVDGKEIDPMEPTAGTILRLLHEPELTHKGQWEIFLCALFLSVLTVISVLFADELFRWKLSWRIADAELAEPSDYELVTRYVSWGILPIVILAMYIMGLQ